MKNLLKIFADTILVLCGAFTLNHNMVSSILIIMFCVIISDILRFFANRDN